MSIPETAHEAQSFSNENVNLTVTRLPNCKVKFDIVVRPSAVEAAQVKAIKNIRKEVSIPGFRKGKAPEAFIMNNYASVIEKEWKDIALETAFQEAMALANIYPLKEGNITRPLIHEFSKEKGASYTIEFETRPIIPAIDMSKIILKTETFHTITEEDRHNALHNYRLQFATYDEVTDRAVQEGDFVNIDIDFIQGESLKRVVDNQRAQVAKEGLPEWVAKKVIGLNGGETAEGETEQNAKDPDPEFVSNPYRVTIRSIWQGNLPELDDELAKKAGLETAEELQTKINEKIEVDLEEEINEKKEQKLLQFLLANYEVEIPQSIIDKNKQERLNSYMQRLKKDGEHASPANIKQLTGALEQFTKSQLQLEFLLHKVVEDHHIEVTQQDISQELTRQINLMSTGKSILNFESGEDSLRNQLHNLAFDRKVKQFLLDKVVFVNE